MSIALVVNHEAMVKEYVEEKFPELGKGRMSRGSGSYDGHSAGRVAGDKVNLTASKKISGSNQRRLN